MDHLFNYQKISNQHVPRIDFHIHTTWTDGAHSAREMYERAVSCRLEKVLFSEHARKTSENWFHKFASEIRALPKNGCEAIVGVETKIIDFDGNLDCTTNIVSDCDYVIASVHRFPGEMGKIKDVRNVSQKEAVDIEFKLACLILENDDVDILGHPFGICYRRFHVKPDEERIRFLIEKAAKANVAFEINSYYHPNPWELINWCKEAGTIFSLGSNAHNSNDVGKIIRVLEGKEVSCNPSEF
jgi:putative hydrolase